MLRSDEKSLIFIDECAGTIALCSSVWKRYMLVAIIDRKIETPLAPILRPPFRLGLLDTLP